MSFQNELPWRMIGNDGDSLKCSFMQEITGAESNLLPGMMVPRLFLSNPYETIQQVPYFWAKVICPKRQLINSQV